ncbi:MAG: hypothetical protein NTX25_02485 [Proteobacteria bacterium]|nr:hypothetical protein [Pseudomonadota bacterium]
MQRDAVQFSEVKAFWFEDEASFFLFYRIDHPLIQRPDSALEFSLNQGNSWTDVKDVQNIHQHDAVDCGNVARCGSLSQKADTQVADIRLRLRFHKDSELADLAEFPVVIVKSSSPFKRSFYIYGIFDTSNTYVQWRGRHQFPGLSHEQAEAYGLRRAYRIQNVEAQIPSSEPDSVNPSLYGKPSSCDGTKLDAPIISSDQGEDHWMINQIDSTYAQVCASSEVHDANGQYFAVAIGRKNPVVAAITQDLQLSYTKVTQVPLVFAVCSAIDQAYLDFQLKRLKIESHPIDQCLDRDQLSPESLLSLLYAKIVVAKQNLGPDIALIIVLHYSDSTFSQAVTLLFGQALEAIANDKNFPRVAAFFIYDSFAPESLPLAKQASVIWCPMAGAEEEKLSSCTFQPASVVVGSLELRNSPALPDYTSFLNLSNEQINGAKIENFSIYAPRETGETGRLIFENVGQMNYVFNPFDQLQLSASETLSFCRLNDPFELFGFESLDKVNPLSANTLSELPDVHRETKLDRSYSLGVRMTVPFFVSIQYSSTVAIGPKNYIAYLALRGKRTVSDAFGAAILRSEALPFANVLSKCTQYCQHPAFDESGSYVLARPWYEEFAQRCYNPLIPTWQKEVL